jgi:cytoskeletal protein CcmA (bactofilin family)
MSHLAEPQNATDTRVVPWVLLSFAASSGVGFYEGSDGVRRLDVVTGQNELQRSGADQSTMGLEFDLIPTRLAFESRDELVSFVRTEYLRDKKNIYYTILFTNKQMDDVARLAILTFLDDPSLTHIKISRALVPTLEEIADKTLAQATQQLARKSGLTNVIQCLSTELQGVVQSPVAGNTSPDVFGYYAKFVESVKRRMGPQRVERQPELQKQPVLENAGSRIKGLTLKGEIVGTQSLFVDDEVEGRIEISQGVLTLGPNAVVQADVKATTIVIFGRIKGNIQATDRVDIRSSAVVIADIVAPRISIEDGAYFKGGIDIVKSGGFASRIAERGVDEAVLSVANLAEYRSH